MMSGGLKLVRPEIQVFLYVEPARDMTKMHRGDFAGAFPVVYSNRPQG
jgi:hypothetical protein